MKLLVISSAPFIYRDGKIFAYGPYLNEMKIWAGHTDEIAFCCPIWENPKGLLIRQADFQVNRHFRLVDFNLMSVKACIKAFFSICFNFCIILRAMAWADHIHLRCPGNIGLLGALAQVFFPRKAKTAKYAGNWDPRSSQPLSYRLQKWILSNTLLARKMTILIYGRWQKMSPNAKPFFTASYRETEKRPLRELSLEGPIKFVFAGMLTPGKNPLYAVKLIEELRSREYEVCLDIFGEGEERPVIEAYLEAAGLKSIVSLKGNQPQEVLAEAFRGSHFVVLPSESEGWPKAIAEGMFWGCIPIAAPVSCLPFMLDDGKRGLLLEMELPQDVCEIENLLGQEKDFASRRQNCAQWSGKYTIDAFEIQVQKLLHP